MSAGNICWLVSIIINIIICTLFCTAVYADHDDKKVLPIGVSVLIILFLGIVKYLATATAFILVILFIALGCSGEIYFKFKNKFLNDLFTR